MKLILLRIDVVKTLSPCLVRILGYALLVPVTSLAFTCPVLASGDLLNLRLAQACFYLRL